MWPAVVKGEITRAPNSGVVAEVIEGLDISGVVVAAASVERNPDGGAGPQSFVGLYFVDDLLHEPSNRSSLKEDGCPSSQPSGFTKDTAGSLGVGAAAILSGIVMVEQTAVTQFTV
jgi:hypothetical protein